MIIHFVNEIGNTPSGAEIIALSLHEGFNSSGVSSQLISLIDEVRPEVGFISLGCKGPYSFVAFSRIRQHLLESAKAGDVLHAHLFPTNILLRLAATSIGWCGPVVTTEHSTFNRRREKWWGKTVDRFLYRGYDRIYCISEGTRQALVDWLPDMADKYVVVNNGLELKYSEYRQPIKNQVPVIASLGRLHPSKNYSSALYAFAEMNDVDFVYRIAGSGALESELKSLAFDLGLESKVEFLGYVDPFEFLASADIYLITSRWEGFGLAAVEAMNSSLPVIASDVPGLREVVGDAGVLVDANNPEEIARVVRGLLMDRGLRVQLGKKAFARSKNYSLNQMVHCYMREYKNLIDDESKC